MRNGGAVVARHLFGLHIFSSGPGRLKTKPFRFWTVPLDKVEVRGGEMRKPSLVFLLPDIHRRPGFLYQTYMRSFIPQLFIQHLPCTRRCMRLSKTQYKWKAGPKP